MAEHKDTQAILGKDLIVKVYFHTSIDPDTITPMELFEPIEVQPFSPAQEDIDVTYYNDSRYRDNIPGLIDPVEITVRGNYATVDLRDQNRLTYTELWEWFRDELNVYNDPLDMLVIYPKTNDLVGQPHGYHSCKVNIKSLEIDPPIDSQMTYTVVFKTSGKIEWRLSSNPVPEPPTKTEPPKSMTNQAFARRVAASTKTAADPVVPK